MQVTRIAPGKPVPSLMHRRRVMADRITYVGLDVHKESHRCRGSVGRSARRGAGIRPDREHGDGAGPFAAQARRRWHGSAVLLRGWTVRLWHSTARVGPGTRVRRGCPLADTEASG